MESALFRADVCEQGEFLTPLPASASGWAAGHLRGVAVSGALARATEHAAAEIVQDQMRPARWTLDMFRPPRDVPVFITATVIRHGGRVGLIDAELRQEGMTVARSRTLFVRPGSNPTGALWSPPHTPKPPPVDLQPLDDEHRIYYSDAVGWTRDPQSHRNGSRKEIWIFPLAIVEAEDPTPFQMTASGADLTSLVVNWGSRGLEFINADITVALTRLPATMELGLSTIHRAEDSGISIGTAALFDREGPIGTATVTALFKSARSVDPGNWQINKT